MSLTSGNVSRQQQTALMNAAQWHVELTDESVTKKAREAWHKWLVEQPENQWAWQRLEKLQRQFVTLPNELAFNSLNASLDSASVQF